MIEKLHVLGIDDHAVVLTGYHTIFKSIDIIEELKFTGAGDCRSGYAAIKSNITDPFDIAVLDYSIPQFAEKGLSSGQDLAMLVRGHMPSCKIIMMTMHKEPGIISSILEKVNPEGFINKSDCDTEELQDAFRSVLKGARYYSPTISKFIDRKSSVLLEDIDVRIILLLAKGIKTKNLNKHIPLSESSIEKRKYRIKRLLDITKGDEELIEKARQLGYI